MHVKFALTDKFLQSKSICSWEVGLELGGSRTGLKRAISLPLITKNLTQCISQLRGEIYWLLRKQTTFIIGVMGPN